jgi:hypothetical protein
LHVHVRCQSIYHMITTMTFIKQEKLGILLFWTCVFTFDFLFFFVKNSCCHTSALYFAPLFIIFLPCSCNTCVGDFMFVSQLWYCHKWQRIFVVNTFRSYPHSWLITGFVARVTRWVPLVERLSSPTVFLKLILSEIIEQFDSKLI